MSILQRLTDSFRKRSQLKSVCVYRRSGSYFVVTQHGCDGSDPCVAAGPLEQLSFEVSHEQLGAAIFRGLERTTHNYPYPASQQQWQQVSAPLLAAAKCKSWSAFAKAASDLRVNQLGNQVTVLPSMRQPRGSFAPVADLRRDLVSPTAQQLGSLVAAELQFAASRDDA